MKTQHISFQTYYLLLSFLFCLFLMLGKWQSWQGSYLLFLGLWLSYHDCQSQEYPLLIWLGMTSLLLFFHPLSISFIIFILIGLLAILLPIPMGAGDFFYLASLSLVLPLQNILWVIQLSSLMGIGFYLLKLNQQPSIPFIPFLVLGYGLMMFT